MKQGKEREREIEIERWSKEKRVPKERTNRDFSNKESTRARKRERERVQFSKWDYQY